MATFPVHPLRRSASWIPQRFWPTAPWPSEAPDGQGRLLGLRDARKYRAVIGSIWTKPRNALPNSVDSRHPYLFHPQKGRQGAGSVLTRPSEFVL
jgi:hypothetical protein